MIHSPEHTLIHALAQEGQQHRIILFPVVWGKRAGCGGGPGLCSAEAGKGRCGSPGKEQEHSRAPTDTTVSNKRPILDQVIIFVLICCIILALCIELYPYNHVVCDVRCHRDRIFAVLSGDVLAIATSSQPQEGLDRGKSTDKFPSRQPSSPASDSQLCQPCSCPPSFRIRSRGSCAGASRRHPDRWQKPGRYQDL